jgi:hypothetical protein
VDPVDPDPDPQHWFLEEKSFYLAGNLSHGTDCPLVECQPLVDLRRVEGRVGGLQLSELGQRLLVLGKRKFGIFKKFLLGVQSWV